MQLVCGQCGETFESVRRTTRWCSNRCRMRHTRAAKAAEQTGAEPAQAAPPEKPVMPPLDAGLTLTLRNEFETAGVLDTFSAQLALTLSRKMMADDASGVSGLAVQLRAARTEALGGASSLPTGAGETPDEPAAEDDGLPDEVRAARARRDAARAAAGGA